MVHIRDARRYIGLWHWQRLCRDLSVPANIKRLGVECRGPLYQCTSILFRQRWDHDRHGPHSLHHADALHMGNSASPSSKIRPSIPVWVGISVSPITWSSTAPIIETDIHSVIAASVARLYVVNDVLKHGDMSCS